MTTKEIRKQRADRDAAAALHRAVTLTAKTDPGDGIVAVLDAGVAPGAGILITSIEVDGKPLGAIQIPAGLTATLRKSTTPRPLVVADAGE